MEIKDILTLSFINKDTHVKCYDGKGSLAEPLFEGKFLDSNFMSNHGREYVVGFGKFDADKNTLEVFICIEK